MRPLVSLKLQGNIPSKKNKYRRGNNNNLYLPQEIKSQLDDFLYQLKKYKPTKPIVVPIRVDISLYCRSLRQDADNMAQTVQDLLQKAMIIKNDNLISELRVTRARGADDVCFVDIYTIHPKMILIKQ